MKNIVRNFWVLLVCLSFGMSATAQKREFKLNSRTGDFAVVSLGQDGLALCYKSQKDIAGDENRYLVSKYDKKLDKEFHLKVDLPSSYKLIETREDKGEVYMLVAVPTTRFSKYGTITEMVATKHFQVVKVNFKSKKHTIIDGVVPSKLFAINSFEVNDGNIYVGGYSAYSSLGAMFSFVGKKPSALVFTAGSKDEEFSLQSTSFKGASLVSAMSKGKEEGIVNVVITNYVSKKEMYFYFLEGKKGRLGKEEAFKFSDSKELVDFSYLEIDRKNKLLAGNFGNFNEENEGIFITRFGGKKGEDAFNKYHKFKNFEDFYSFVEKEPGKDVPDEEKAFSNLSKRKNFQYSVYMHDVFMFDANAADTTNNKPKFNYLMVGEAYYPEYKTETIDKELDNGFTISTQQNIFHGYRFTHVVVAGIDEKGDIDWSMCLPIFNIATYQIKPRVEVKYGEDGSITLTYGNEGMINQIVIKDGEIVSETKPKEGLNNKELFIVKNQYNMDLQYWYDDYFIASGYKKFDYYAEGEKLIFFMNRVQVGNSLDFTLDDEVTEDE